MTLTLIYVVKITLLSEPSEGFSCRSLFIKKLLTKEVYTIFRILVFAIIIFHIISLNLYLKNNICAMNVLMLF